MIEEKKLTDIIASLSDEEAYSSESTDAQAQVEPHYAAQPTQPFKAPRTETEKAIAEIWSCVLRVERVGVNDDFFSLGGDSLKAQRMLVQVEHDLGINIPVVVAFANPTVAQLSFHIDRSRIIDMTEEEELASIIASLSDEEVSALLGDARRPAESNS